MQEQHTKRRLTMAHLSVLLALIAMLAFTVTASAKATTVQEIQLADSSAFPEVDAKARFKEDRGERELRVEIEDANRLVGQTLNVYVDGANVGTMEIDIFGNGRLNRNTDLGQFVPMVHDGSTVEIMTTGGTFVASGIFN